jgi:hypothetical protein
MAAITIVIDREGGATVGVGCMKGKKCSELTKGIEDALGKVVSDQKTSEYFEAEHAKTNL